jgi:rRNA maturation protein Rpf1
MFTTSRYASVASTEFAKQLASRANSIFCARGKKTIAQLAQTCRKDGEGRLVIVMEKSDLPSVLKTIEVLPSGKWRWISEQEIEAKEIVKKKSEKSKNTCTRKAN